MSDDSKDLTAKQQRFVKSYSTGEVTATQAVLDAGYKPTNPNSANSMATTLMANPKIKSAIVAEIDREFPDLTHLAGKAIHDILVDSDAKHGEKLNAVKLLADLKGWLAPKRHASISMNIQDKFKLPEE